MSNSFTSDMAANSETLNPNSIYKQNMMLEFMEKKSIEPEITQKQI